MTASKSQPPSRRDVVSAGGAALAVAASSPAIANSSQVDEESVALRDPTGKYPNPPFPTAVATLARPCRADDSSAGPRREQLSRVAAACRTQGADHRAATRAWAAPRRLLLRARAPTSPSTICPRNRRTRGEVIDLIRTRAGRKDCRHSRRPSEKSFCRRAGRTTQCEALGGLDILVMNAGRQQTRESILDAIERRLRRHDEDQHLCAVLDHQGGAASFARRARHHRARPPSRPMIPRRTFSTTRKPKRRR